MSRKPAWYIWVLFIALLSSVFLALFAGQTKPIEVTIAEGNQIGFGLVYIAEANGYFKDEGLKVKYRKFSLGKFALADMLAGNSDFATVYETPVIHEIYQGAPVSILATLHHSSRNTRLVANTARGIKTPEDLIGKNIATVKGTSPEFFLNQLLRDNGILPSRVHILDLPAENITTALTEGSVDAATVWNVSFDSLQKESPDKLVEFFSDTSIEISLLTSRTQYVRNNKKIVAKVLKSLRQAELFYENNPIDALQILKTHFSEQTAVDIEYTWERITLDLRLDNLLVTTLAHEADFLRTTGIYTDPAPQFRNFLSTEGLRAVNPESVTVF